MKESSIWVRLEGPEELGELQSFALQLLRDGLGGEIRLKVYIEHQMRIEIQSHIYDLSEDALIPLYEKYGEENVMLVKQSETDHGLRPDLLDRIADALDRIDDSLDSISASLETLSDCTKENPNGSRCMMAIVNGDIRTY